MKKLVATLVAIVFGATLLSAPAVGISVPGNSCNPPAGHGRSGCHRVTVSAAPSAAQTRAKAAAQAAARAKAQAKAKAAQKRAAEKRAARAAAKAAAAQQAADALAAAQAAPATTPATVTLEATRAPIVPAVAKLTVPAPAKPAPEPWWLALWHLIAR